MKPINRKEIDKCDKTLPDFTTNESIMTVINLVDKLSELTFRCSVDWSFIIFESESSFLFNFIYKSDNEILLRCNHSSTQDRWSNCDFERKVWILRDGSIFQEGELVKELKYYFENWDRWDRIFGDGKVF